MAELRWKGETAMKALRKGAQDAIDALAVDMVATTKKTLSRSGSTRADGNTPSRPGQPPAVQTGNLRRSITQRRMERGRQHFQRVGTNVEYARIHEFGGRINHPGGTAFIMIDGKPVFVSNEVANAGGNKLPRTKPHVIPMPARPFMRPSLQKVRKRAKATVKRFMGQAIAKVSADG